MKDKQSAKMIFQNIREEFELIGYCDDVSIDIDNHCYEILNLGKTPAEKKWYAQTLLNMLSGRELCELLPVLKAYGAVYGLEAVLGRIDEVYLDEGRIRSLVDAGIPIGDIADRFCNPYNFWTFIDAGMQPLWLLRETPGAEMVKADLFYYYDGIDHLLECTHPESRRAFFEGFLNDEKDGKNIRFSREHFFSMRPLLEAGLTPDEVVEIILGKSEPHLQAYELFSNVECFRKLGLFVDVRKYLDLFFKGASIQSRHGVLEEIVWVCMNYALDANDVLEKVDVFYLLDSLKRFSFKHFINSHPTIFSAFDVNRFSEYVLEKIGAITASNPYFETTMSLYSDLRDIARERNQHVVIGGEVF